MENKNTEKDNELKGNFSVALGLFDYINPILYSITSITILINLFGVMKLPMYIIYAIGVAISLVFGFTIPTVKVIVGTGKMQFKMPVNLVSYVNTGIFISGLMIFGYTLNVKPLVYVAIIVVALAVLGFILSKSGKFNTVAVLIGAIGYLLIYISLITLSIRAGVTLPIILYALAICLFLFLVGLGIKGDLKNAKVHWVIEASNVCCQLSVAIATLILFCGK